VDGAREVVRQIQTRSARWLVYGKVGGSLKAEGCAAERKAISAVRAEP
jgi:hypothetical protein